MHELSAGRSKTERDAVIVVDKQNAAAGKIRLNYLVDAASWRPQYKFRAGKEEKDAVQVEYLAAVTQQTGEEWNNVRLEPVHGSAHAQRRAAGAAKAGSGGDAPRSGYGDQPAYASEAGSAIERTTAAGPARIQPVRSQTGRARINEAAALEQTNDLLNAKTEDRQEG